MYHSRWVSSPKPLVLLILYVFVAISCAQALSITPQSNMIIVPGNASYPIDVHYSPQGASALAAGQQLLENFLQGVDSDSQIAGTTGSTPISSLQTALSEILLKPVTIPAIHQTLIQSATIEFPTDIVQTGFAQAAFTLANPFTASINLLQVGATATFQNLTLGTINADVSTDPIHADGHSSVTSSFLPMKYNLEPLVIVQFLSILAEQNSVDLGPLVEMFQFLIDNPNIKVAVNTTVDTAAPTCVSGHQFDVAGAILATLKNLKVDLAVDTNVKLDDFATPLSFAQKSIPVIVRSLLLLVLRLPNPNVIIDRRHRLVPYRCCCWSHRSKPCRWSCIGVHPSQYHVRSPLHNL